MWSLFGATPEQERDFLYRLDWRNRTPELVIVSRREPVDAHGIFELECRTYEPNLEVGDELVFSLRANATKDKIRSGKPSLRVDIVMDRVRELRQANPGADVNRVEIAKEAGRIWLSEKGKRCGFVVQPDHVVVDSYRAEPIGRNKSTLAQIDFRGRLSVTDPAAFNQALVSGIGRAKAFGCGLMLVRRG